MNVYGGTIDWTKDPNDVVWQSIMAGIKTIDVRTSIVFSIMYTFILPPSCASVIQLDLPSLITYSLDEFAQLLSIAMPMAMYMNIVYACVRLRQWNNNNNNNKLRFSCSLNACMTPLHWLPNLTPSVFCTITFALFSYIDRRCSHCPNEPKDWVGSPE